MNPILMLSSLALLAAGTALAQEADLQKADAELNASYRQIRERLKGDAAKTDLLAKAERAWVAFRDAECAFAASGVEGGSVQPTVLAGCRADLTQKRVEELKEYLACEEGDLSCPVPSGN